MEQNNKKYNFRKYQWMASISVALFIVSFAFCLTAMNRSVYTKYSNPEEQLYYEQIADSFCTFFGKGYTVSGYEVSSYNTDRLNSLKHYYRWAWVVSLLSLGGGVYSFGCLARRRESAPLYYGASASSLLVAFLALRLVCSKKEIFVGLRDMIFRDDYSYFGEGDILREVLPQGFARGLALYYLLMVFALIGGMVLIRLLIRFAGRPHKY